MRVSIGNQKGEVMTGVMVVIMVVVMFFGGMHMMHGDHRHGEDHDRIEHRQDHQKEEMNHKHNGDEGRAPVQDHDEEQGEQK